MKILLDECVDRRFAREIVTVPDAGWASVKNGELLQRATRTFDVFVTVDRNLSFQQNVAQAAIAVVVLHSRTNRLVDLRRLAPQLLKAIPTAPRGAVTVVE